MVVARDFVFWRPVDNRSLRDLYFDNFPDVLFVLPTDVLSAVDCASLLRGSPSVQTHPVESATYQSGLLFYTFLSSSRVEASANKRTCCPEIGCQMFDNPGSFTHTCVFCLWAHTGRNLGEQPSLSAASLLHTDECRYALDISLQLAF